MSNRRARGDGSVFYDSARGVWVATPRAADVSAPIRAAIIALVARAPFPFPLRCREPLPSCRAGFL